jgi:hypothetical protein
MTFATSAKRATGVWLLGMVLVPLLVMSTALYVTRRFSLVSVGWDYASIALSVAAGLPCLFRLPSSVSFLSRTWLAILYVPAVAGLLMLYALFFVGVVFGDWL